MPFLAPTLQTLITASSIAFSFLITGNNITQSTMSLPAILVNFPLTSDDASTRARLIGQQWVVFYNVGNVLFRPASSLGALGYGLSALSAYQTPSSSSSGKGRAESAMDYRLLLAACLGHVVMIVYSATVMQPLNQRILDLADESKVGAKACADTARELVTQWAGKNWVRAAASGFAGTMALSALVGRA